MAFKFEGNRIVWALPGGGPRARLWAFLPGIMMVLLGLLVAFSPAFFVYVIATMFLMIGGLLILGGWKVLLMRDQFNHILRNVRTEIQLHRFDPGAVARTEIIEEEEVVKKVVYH